MSPPPSWGSTGEAVPVRPTAPPPPSCDGPYPPVEVLGASGAGSGPRLGPGCRPGPGCAGGRRAGDSGVMDTASRRPGRLRRCDGTIGPSRRLRLTRFLPISVTPGGGRAGLSLCLGWASPSLRGAIDAPAPMGRSEAEADTRPHAAYAPLTPRTLSRTRQYRILRKRESHGGRCGSSHPWDEFPK